MNLILSLLITLSGANTMYNEKITIIDGAKKETTLNEYKGKPVLIVNIATQCGYTKQLDGLEKIYEKYKTKGLVVLGIPSNDFGGQTPEADGDVKKFCKLRYGVTFPLTTKQVVKGEGKHPLVAQLISADGKAQEIAWNFEKFLLDKNGKLVGRFKSSVEPENAEFVKSIEKVL
ncbi:MAG: glutathione peroxidase [Bdellovibrionaceae bacterium]|nr:glutathione peroxidase [Pseudobdellovibrionaceae bacterium]